MFYPEQIGLDDRQKAVSILGGWREPDLTIAPAGDKEPYLFRWHVFPRNVAGANCYFHIQVASDPERPLHDHPWDNCSVILAGGYVEVIDQNPADEFPPEVYTRSVGDVIYRKATWAHRLILPREHPYTMTLFQTGPVLRDWGFWFPDGWRPHVQVVRDEAGVSTFLQPGAK